MATRNATPADAPVKHQRQLKVCKACSSHQTSQKVPIGQIQLKGHWLQLAGFEIDALVKVRIMTGCLVLTAQPESVEPLEGFNQLSQREQQLIKSILEELLVKYQNEKQLNRK